jgi:glycosyltransferase involved in cell wall biosynthesis
VKISIVVPAYNEEKLIARTLERIQAAAAAFHKIGWETELIVCDNNSSDSTARLAQSAGARVVFEPINQISRARNRGAEAASGEWLLFIDADSSPGAALFEDVARAIQGGRCLAGGCTIRMDQPKLMMCVATGGWNLISRIMKWAAGSFIFCETRAFRRVAGFSTELFVSEELDLSRRLKKLARREGRTFLILRRHPLETSARKAHLYSPFEMVGFMIRAVLFPFRTMKNRAACQPWYDGRR